MIKKLLYMTMPVLILLSMCSCALFQGSVDKRTGFSDLLRQTEDNIRKEDWTKAGESLEASQKTWERLKPFLQIDIDHDYVNDIESDFIRLEGYIEAREKGNSLSSILLVKDTWENIGTL